MTLMTKSDMLAIAALLQQKFEEAVHKDIPVEYLRTPPVAVAQGKTTTIHMEKGKEPDVEEKAEALTKEQEVYELGTLDTGWIPKEVLEREGIHKLLIDVSTTLAKSVKTVYARLSAKAPYKGVMVIPPLRLDQLERDKPQHPETAHLTEGAIRVVVAFALRPC